MVYVSFALMLRIGRSAWRRALPEIVVPLELSAAQKIALPGEQE